MAVKKLNRSDFLQDLKKGMNDDELMQKYEIPNVTILTSLFDKLVLSKEISQFYINDRVNFNNIKKCSKCTYKRTEIDDIKISKKICPKCRVPYEQSIKSGLTGLEGGLNKKTTTSLNLKSRIENTHIDMEEKSKNPRVKTEDEKFCSNCGEIISIKRKICPECKVDQGYYALPEDKNGEEIGLIDKFYDIKNNIYSITTKLFNKYIKHDYIVKILGVNKKTIGVMFLVIVIFNISFAKDSEEIVHDVILKEGRFYDPNSVMLREIEHSPSKEYYCGWINAKNRMGGYVGWEEFIIFSPIEKILLYKDSHGEVLNIIWTEAKKNCSIDTFSFKAIEMKWGSFVNTITGKKPVWSFLK